MCSIPAARALALVGLLAAASACRSGERGPLREAAGHSQPVYGGELRFADEEDFRTLDPAIAYDEVSWIGLRLLFDTLLEYDDDVRLSPALAESWEVSDDGLVWTFHLRRGVRFHNGRELVADDVIASWERLFHPDVPSPGRDFLGVIEGTDALEQGLAEHASGLSAPDAYTVIARLSQPKITFGNSVAMFFAAVVPIEEVAARGESWGQSPVGTGPFRLVEWHADERAVFERNDAYYKPGLPYLDRVVYLARYPWSVQFLKVEADELHHVNRLTSPDYLWLKKSEAWAPYVRDQPQVDTYAEMMNTELPPFDDVWFRRAVSAAIDRDKLARLRNYRSLPTSSWLPPALDGYEEGLPYQVFDPEAAKRYLAQAGYPDGYPAVIPYWTLTSETALVTAQSVQQDLRAIGIDIEIKNVTFPVYLTATGRRRTVAFAYTAWVMDYPDPENFLATRFRCDNRAEQNSNNDSFYCNPEVDRLLALADVETDHEARVELYRQAHRLVAADVPYAFEYHTVRTSVRQPYVKGVSDNPVYVRDFNRAWLDLPSGRAKP